MTLSIDFIDETERLSEEEIEQMKQGVVIINSSRGGIIDTDALLKGLQCGKISSAALDVMENEHLNLGVSHPLVSYANKNDNLLITPHIGGSTLESIEKTDIFILKKFMKSIDTI